MMDNFSKSNVTWPRSQIPLKILSDMKKSSLPVIMKDLKTRANELNDDELKALIDEIDAHRQRLQGKGYYRALSISSNIVSVEQPQSGSSQLNNTNIDAIDPLGTLSMKPCRTAQIFTFLFAVCCFFSYLLIGTVIFQEIDSNMRNKTFFTAFMLPLQTCLTIGWGNFPLTAASSQLFCILYAIIGVPLCHTTLTRIGKALYNVYVPDWILNSAAIRHTPGRKEKVVPFSLFSALKYLCVFHIVGLVMFNGFLENFGTIESIYFDYYTSAFIGFGDIIPNPNSYLESFILFLYLPCGGIFQAIVHACGSYHIQRFFYVIFKNWLYKIYLKKINR